MPIFHEQALRAGAGEDKALSWLRPEEHLADWHGLAEALDRLCPEQRCDAIYADWLMRLNDNRTLILPIRDLLLGQGALDAKYLAELAQNADDASDGQPAEIRIHLEDDWLVVGNNGRKVTSMNLLGLCRFFVHAAGDVVELNDQTIGRFGIGFKSCYQIASEVFVRTWDQRGSFVFRLPICRQQDQDSRPDPVRLQRILDRLRKAGLPRLDQELLDNEMRYLGYCTPEFQGEVLPPQLAQAAVTSSGERGTVFCFHIRSERLQEVASLITGHERELYELCPLFLPNLRTIQIAQHELRMSVSRRDGSHDVPGNVEGDKVTLSTRDLADADAAASHSRFWRLRGIGQGDLWQVALHADSQFRLHVEHADDEQGTTIKDGSAYAFFPLDFDWPFRIHLHIKLPTNLQRGDWNPADAPHVEEQLRRAIGGLAAWLDQHERKWHPAWRLESLVDRVPNWPERWPWLAWNSLKAEADARRLLRTLVGGRLGMADAQYLQIHESEGARDSWDQLGRVAELGELLPRFVGGRTSLFGVPRASPDEVADAFTPFLARAELPAAVRCAGLLAYLSCRQHSMASLQRTLRGTIVEREDGTTVTLRELMTEPGGAELLAVWHACFRTLSAWSPASVWQDVSVFDRPLSEQVRKLSQSVFNVAWAELPTRMGSLEVWQQRGAEFWANPRLPCPGEHRRSALAALHVPDGDGQWLPLQGLWVDDDGPVDCFSGLLLAWPLPYRDPGRRRVTQCLQEWGLFDEWTATAKHDLQVRLPGVLTRRLTEHAGEDALEIVLGHAFQEARQILDDGWKYVVNEAEKLAVRQFVAARTAEANLSGKTVVSAGIAPAVAAALCLDHRYVRAPAWLTDTAYRRIGELGLQQSLGFAFLDQQALPQRRESLVRGLLDRFYDWDATAASGDALAGLETLAAAASRTNRRNWPVGLSAHTKPLLKELIHTQSGHGNATPAEQLSQLLLQDASWRNATPLPAVLAQIPSIAAACVQPDRLELQIAPGVALTPIERDQVPDAARGVACVNALLEAGGHQLFASSHELDLCWVQDGDVVATLAAAEYVLDGDRLIFARSLPPADEEQYRNVLALYQWCDNPSAAYVQDRDSGMAPFQLYQRHRDHITQVLLDGQVQALGYSKKHVLRELLQNAESAYASQASPPTEPWFQFIVDQPDHGTICRVTAKHAGRAFNERDKNGQERPDVERIVKISAPNQNTEDEIGRFNKGFKCVFGLAHDQRVRIKSGGYCFDVQDLLLRFPAHPERDPNDTNTETTFSFDATFPDLMDALGLAPAAGATTALPVIESSSLVFLRYLQRVTVQFPGWDRAWRIQREPETAGWVTVTVNQGAGAPGEAFRVFHGSQPHQGGRRYAVAIPIGVDGLPRALSPSSRWLRLTFETEEKLDVGVLVNGQFDAEPGRRKLLNVQASGLVDAALDAAIARCRMELVLDPSRERWMAWAQVLNLRDRLAPVSQQLRDHDRVAKQVEQILTARIPHSGSTRSVAELTFPTRLMRVLLREQYATRWGIDSTNWIEADVESELPNAERTKLRLTDWINQQPRLSHSLRLAQRDIQAARFQTLAQTFTGPQKEEFREAGRVLEERLTPDAPALLVEPVRDAVSYWSAADVWRWWQGQGAPSELYTLDGQNWPLLSPGDDTAVADRRTQLRRLLSQPDEDRGRKIWYRLLGMACLMSAGWGRLSTMRDFWHDELEARQFWELTAGGDFSAQTSELFRNLVGRQHDNTGGSGEAAEYWRHVFYDVRKVHELVWNRDFAETVLRLASDPARALELPGFLREGRLTGQPNWSGVLGQSAGAPIFFVVRELCRLEVVTGAALGQLRPLAFFACTPVRRAAARLGWIESALANRWDFSALALVSEKLHQLISSDASLDANARRQMLDLYDIPLLHFGLTA